VCPSYVECAMTLGKQEWKAFVHFNKIISGILIRDVWSQHCRVNEDDIIALPVSIDHVWLPEFLLLVKNSTHARQIEILRTFRQISTFSTGKFASHRSKTCRYNLMHHPINNIMIILI